MLTLLIFGITVISSAGGKRHQSISKSNAVEIVRKEAANDTLSKPRLVKKGRRQFWEVKAGTGESAETYRVDVRDGSVAKVGATAPLSESASATDSFEDIALRKIPGTVVSTVHGERNGKQIATVRVQTKKGKFVEVDVDEQSKKIDRIQTED